MSVSPSSSARLAGAAAAILLASASVFLHAAPGAVPPVVVAVQASGSGAIERSFISASVDHLTYALPDTPLVFRYLPLGEIQKLAESRRVDFVLAPPDGYVVLERFFGARSLVSQTIRESSSADSVLGIVVAVNAAKAPDASASVLNGASILVPELDGMPARMLRRELMHAGVERAVPEALRTKTDDPEGAILEAVASGRADAGILPACYVERLSATDPKRLSGIRLVTTDRASQTRCRSFSVFYPGWTLASFPHTPPELNALVSGTLLGMPTDADGCDWRPGARYDAVHELLEALGDAAYLRQSQFSWEAFVRNYGVWLAFLAAVLLGIVVHSVRAEYLIRRRTTELMRAVEEKRRVEEEAKRYNERLVAMERAGLVGELSSMIAHELKQPLAVIRNYARGLSRTMAHGGSTDPEVFRTVLAKIDSQSTKASDIIDHVRSFARQPAQPVPTSLSDLAEKAIAQFCATRGLEVSRRIEPGVTILADALEMELLISNLLKNAADATAGTDDAVIRANLSAEDGTAMLTISDNGPRLTDEQFARLTIPLNTSKPQGLGLGLVIVRRIVDDDAEMRESLEFLLSTEGWKSRSYASAEAFLETDDVMVPGCLILDIRMPGLSGLQLQELLKKKDYSLPILFITAHGDITMAVEAVKNGAFDFLPKPLDDEKLLASVEKAIALDWKRRSHHTSHTAAMKDLATLTPREREVAGLVAEGLLNKVIAERLGIAEKTVQIHRGQVCRKLKVRSAVEISRILDQAEGR